jgi:hypothetical protein
MRHGRRDALSLAVELIGDVVYLGDDGERAVELVGELVIGAWADRRLYVRL